MSVADGRAAGRERPGRAPASKQDRVEAGRAARRSVPREAHAEFRARDSRDPVGLLLDQAHDRVPDLVPIRHGRMLVSPFTFYRGAALVMAADLHGTPTTSLRTQLCGDAHLSNFGAYASPERRLVFDINDFDETLPGPFEWDVKRLASSFVVAARDNGFTAKQCRRAAQTAVETYRTAMRSFATQSTLTVWYARLEIEDVLADYRATLTSEELKKRSARFKQVQAQLRKARVRDSVHAIGKLTTMADGRRRIVSDPPLVVPIDQLSDFDLDELLARLQDLVAAYQGTLQADRRRLFDHFALADAAHKVVGVGSVGTRAWILLFDGLIDGDALVLQAKQAGPSVLADYAGASEHEHGGERVVSGQRLMQAASDIFLGWVTARSVDGQTQHYYVRQLRDWKVSAELEGLRPEGLVLYARLCGWTLARAHARSGDRLSIASYLGKSPAFDHAVTEFAEIYADQNERDHATLAEAVRTGRVEALSGV